MPASYTDFYLDQGSTFTVQIPLEDQYGTPYNLTNFSVKGSAKKSYTSANTSILFNSSIVDAINGVIQLSANNLVTANVSAPQTLVYDVVITDQNSGNKTRVLEGRVFVSAAVS